MFKWTPYAVEIAIVLSKAGFSANEAALVLNTSKSSILSRSIRKKEFQFSAQSRATPMPESERNARLKEARELVKGVTPPAEHKLPEPRIPRKEMLALKGRRGGPTVIRASPTVEKPLTSSEKKMIFSSDKVNPESVPFFNMKEHHCRWIVEDVDGLTMVCGRKKIEESSYCQHHYQRSISPYQPKKINYKAVSKLDQNIVHGVPGTAKSSSVLKKS